MAHVLLVWNLLCRSPGSSSGAGRCCSPGWILHLLTSLFLLAQPEIKGGFSTEPVSFLKQLLWFLEGIPFDVVLQDFFFPLPVQGVMVVDV